MPKSSGRGIVEGGTTNERLIAQNRKARHDYEVLDTLECGIVLVGSEVKSLAKARCRWTRPTAGSRTARSGWSAATSPNTPRPTGSTTSPAGPASCCCTAARSGGSPIAHIEQGLTLVPLKMYFKRGRAKVLMGICRGRSSHDKREAMKKAEAHREISGRSIGRGMRGRDIQETPRIH